MQGVAKIKDKFIKVVAATQFDPATQGRVDDITTVINALENHCVQGISTGSSQPPAPILKQKQAVEAARSLDDRINQFFRTFGSQEEIDYIKARCYQVLYAEGLRITKVNSDLVHLEKKAREAGKKV